MTPVVAASQPPSTGRDDRSRVRVLVADGDGLARRMMRDSLHQAGRLVVIGTARDQHETVQLTRHYRPDVLVMDTDLAPDGCGELISRVLTASPDTRVVTVSDDDLTGLAALRAGAVGHTGKDVEPEALGSVVLLAAAGEAIVPRRLVMPLLRLVQTTPDAGWRPLRSRLTTREWEVIELLATGASTQHIADSLVLSATTVYSHIKSVLRKLGVHSRRDAVAAAQRLRDQEIAEQAASLDMIRC